MVSILKAWWLLLFWSWIGTVSAATLPLRVVLEISPPHQLMVEDGKVGGLTTIVVQDLLTRSQLKAEFEVYPWARALKIASHTPNVLIYNIARTPEREKFFHWIGTVASYKFGFVKLTKRHDVQIRHLQDAKNFVVGAQRDDFSADWLKAKGFIDGKQLQLQPDVAETWKLLVNGKIDLLIDDPHSIGFMLAKYKLQRTDIEFVLFADELELETWIAIQKDSDPALVERLRRAYLQVVHTAAYRQVMQRPSLPLDISSR